MQEMNEKITLFREKLWGLATTETTTRKKD